MLFTAYADLQLNTSFNQRLRVIAPYIDDQQEELFVSKWSRMSNRKDFELINREIEGIAVQKHLTLPLNY